MLVQSFNSFYFVQSVNVNNINVPAGQLPRLRVIPDPAVRPGTTQ